MVHPESTPTDEGRWIRAIILLSLDVTLPFYQMLGLRITSPEAFQGALRAFIREYRNFFYSNNTEAAELRVSNIVRFIALNHTPDWAHALDWWFGKMYCEAANEHVALRIWTLIFRYARNTDSIWEKLSLPHAISTEARERFNQSIYMDDYYRLCEEVWKRPLSDWDLHFYAICLWDDDALEAPNGPQSKMYPIVAAAKALSFWSWLLPRLSGINIQALNKAGQEAIETVEELRYLNPAVPVESIESSLK